MNIKHTPGPWVSEKPKWFDPNCTRHIYDTTNRLVARINFANPVQSENEAIANARLIEAAPRMADAIRAATRQASVMQLGEYSGMVMMPRALYDELENALNAATGEYDTAEG